MIRRIFGILSILAGIALFLLSDYIIQQVEEGKEQIRQGQKKVNTIRSASSMSPYTKDLGGMVADSGQQKIDAGKEEVIKYKDLANQIHLGATVLVVLGVGLIGISFIHKKR